MIICYWCIPLRIIVQIRPLRDWNKKCLRVLNFATKGSNQTVAGLKYRHDCSGCTRRAGSNQTVAGLKYIKDDRQFRSILNVQIRPLRDWNQAIANGHFFILEFKSDRCGIEIYIISWTWRDCMGFKSDRCGIEISSEGLVSTHHSLSSNQTVAGLKWHRNSTSQTAILGSNQTVAGLKS